MQHMYHSTAAELSFIMGIWLWIVVLTVCGTERECIIANQEVNNTNKPMSISIPMRWPRWNVRYERRLSFIGGKIVIYW